MSAPSDLTLAKRERRGAKGKFTRAANTLKKALTSKAPLRTTKNRMDELTAVWKEVQEKHEKFMLLVDSDAEEDEEEWIEEMSVQFEELELENDQYTEKTLKGKESEEKEKERKIVETTEKQQKESERADRIKEIQTRRSQEKSKFEIAVKGLTKMMEVEKEGDQKHQIESINAELAHVKERLNNCEKFNDRLVLERGDGEASSETDWISSLMETYSKIAKEARSFLSRYGNKTTVVKTLESTNKGNTHLEKLKF